MRFLQMNAPALGAAALLLTLSGADWAAAQNDPAVSAKPQSRTRICLSEDGKPTERCIAAQDLSLRMGPSAAPSGGRSDRIDLTFRITPDDLKRLRELGAATGAANEVEICIVNGANICPPEPLEIVWTCITTGLPAGSECPEPPEAAGGMHVTVNLKSHEWTSSWCRCLSKCGTAQFFVNVQEDPLINEEGVMGSPEHCEAHAQISCAAQNKVLASSACPKI
jgi:hypothetical protein